MRALLINILGFSHGFSARAHGEDNSFCNGRILYFSQTWSKLCRYVHVCIWFEFKMVLHMFIRNFLCMFTVYSATCNVTNFQSKIGESSGQSQNLVVLNFDHLKIHCVQSQSSSLHHLLTQNQWFRIRQCCAWHSIYCTVVMSQKS